jgi:hypothetical protein
MGWGLSRQIALNAEQRDLSALHTVIGEFRLNLTAMQVHMQVQITDVVARIVRLESAASAEALALQKFSLHVEACEKSNDASATSQKSFRKELRAYAVAMLGAALGAVAFLLYHGFSFKGMG